MRGVPPPWPSDLPGVGATRARLDGLVLAAGRGTGQIRRAPHAAGHRGHRARQLGAPQGFRPKGATKAAAPPTARPPDLTPAAYGGSPLAAHLSLDWPRPVPRGSRPGRQARRAAGAPLNNCEENPHTYVPAGMCCPA